MSRSMRKQTLFGRTRLWHRMLGKMRADSASHLLRQPISFELFLFLYLVCALLLQKINIYRKNVHLIDVNLVIFTIMILSRRLSWCTLQELQAHWNPKSSNGSLNFKRWMVVACTLLVIAWSVVRLIQQTSLFNLLFLFYPLLLYLSLFGFTLEPRYYRGRFQPPNRFLHHINFSARLKSKILNQLFGTPPPPSPTSPPSSSSSSTPATNNSNHSPSSAPNATGSGATSRRQTLEPQDSQGERARPPAPSQNQVQRSDMKYTWEYALLLPATPEEIRKEVDILLSDLIVRLKQLLFNSLLCAYYVGFIPMQFADSHLYYDRWWCVEHAFLVWANSFVFLSTHLLPPSYCQLLHQCALHLGCWTRCIHDENASIWSPDTIWPYDVVVQWNGESFKGEGLQNVAIPCDSSQECFYLLFHSRLHVHTWLLTMQCIMVAFQIVVLLRALYWFQTLSMSVFLTFNYFVLYKLLYNRLWFRIVPVLS